MNRIFDIVRNGWNFPRTRGQALGLAAVLPVAFIAVLWLFVAPAFFQPDVEFFTLSSDYRTQVEDLLDGKGFRSFRYPPLFPLMLAAIQKCAEVFGMSEGLVGAAFLLGLAIAGSVLIFLLAESLYGFRLGLVAAAGWSFYPVIFRMWLQPLSAAPFTLFLLFAVLLLVRAVRSVGGRLWSFAAIGMTLGLAMLTRPIGIGLGFVFSGYILTFFKPVGIPRKALWVGILLAAQIATILPWEFYAWQRTGHVIPLSTGGTPSILDGLTYAVDPSENRPLWVPKQVRLLQETIYEKSYRELNSVGSVARFMLLETRKEAGPVATLFAIKAARSWYGTDAGRLDGQLLLFQLPTVGLMFFGLGLTFQRGGQGRGFSILVLLLVAYFWIMTTISLSIVRYMVPALALLMVTMPALFESFGGWKQRRDRLYEDG